MSDTLERSKQSKKPAESTPPKPSGLSESDLDELRQRLALMLGHANAFPISGVTVINGFVIFAVKIPGHELSVYSATNTILLDGKDVTRWSA
jgi:hypothetical protein